MQADVTEIKWAVRIVFVLQLVILIRLLLY
jgi:hypothetical protein